MTVETAIALNRFGLGARPDEQPPDDPRAWLTEQFTLFDPSTPLLSKLTSISERRDASTLRPAPKLKRARRQKVNGRPRRIEYQAGVEALVTAALTTSAQFV